MQTTVMPLSSARVKPKKKDPLNMKIPHNPKYQHIKSGLDTGASMSKYMSKIEEIRTNYRYRKDEIFKRMKMSTFVQLVIKVAEYKQPLTDFSPDVQLPSTPTMTQDRQDNNPSPSISIALTDGDFGDESVMNTARSTLEGVSRGIGEMDLNSPTILHTHSPVSQLDCPYLLLDIRDPDCYSQCHIISAVNYPIAMLSRSVNGEIKELLGFKNRAGRIILVYDDDERIATRAATTLVERGYDNLFLLSGGLRLAARFYTDGFITGTLPISISHQKPTQVTWATKQKFSDDDIEKLELLLDNALSDHSVGGRLSKASTTSSRMSLTSNASRNSASDFFPLRPPFRP